MPGIEEFLDYINEKIPYVNKIFTTNGSALKYSLYKRFMESKYNIQISLSASNKNLHRAITRMDNFEFILEKIEKIISLRKDRTKPGISLVFTMNTLNIEDLADFIKLAIKIGVDEVICNYMVVYTPAHLKLSCFFKQDITNKMLNEAEEIAKISGIRLNIPPKFIKYENNKVICSQPWRYFYVETEGSVLPCCFAGSHIGYLNKESFSNIWNGEAYQRLRRDIVENRFNEWCSICYKNDPNNVNNIYAHVSFRKDLQEKILKKC